MNYKIILAIAISILIIIFAIQNTIQVNLKLFGWSIDGSLSLFLIICIMIGIIIGTLFTFSLRKKNKKIGADKSQEHKDFKSNL